MGEKELIERAVIATKIGDQGIIELKKSNLEKELNKEKEAKVNEIGEQYEIFFPDSNRYYKIDKKGNIIGSLKSVEDKEPGDFKKDKSGNILDGSENSPYEINCIEDLVELSKEINLGYGNSNSEKFYILNTTLDFKSIASYCDYETTIYGDINKDGKIEGLMKELTTGDGFETIGNPTNKMMGSFDGKGNSIKNIYINKENETYQGLFGYVEGNVKNLNVSGQIIAKSNCGGITGWLSNGKIEKCRNYCDIKVSSGNAGGISGYINGENEVIDCYNEGNIESTGGQDVGGISSCNYKGGKINRCVNKGNINGKGINIGGILGSNWNYIYNCINLGSVNGIQKVGGITGYEWAAYIYYSCNLGDIKAQTGETGGVAGWNGGSKIFYSFSTGDVSTASGNIGAIAGRNTGNIYDSYYYDNNNYHNNDKIITGNPVGYNTGKYTNCSNYGDGLTSFYKKEFLIDKVKFGKYNSDEDVVQNSNNCWKIDEINRPMLYWEQ